MRDHCLWTEQIVTPKDNAGWTPLHDAVIGARFQIVALLLQYGANPSVDWQVRNAQKMFPQHAKDCFGLYIEENGIESLFRGRDKVSADYLVLDGTESPRCQG